MNVRRGATWRRSLLDERASLAVEMAILLPLVFALLFAIIDVSRLLLTRSLLDQLAQSLADHVRRELPMPVRAHLPPAALEAHLSGLAASVTGGMLQADALTLSVEHFPDLASLAAGVPSDGSDDGAAGLTAYRLEYEVPFLTPFVNYLYPSGAALESVYLVIRNDA